jgi:hypothetical protein
MRRPVHVFLATAALILYNASCGSMSPCGPYLLPGLFQLGAFSFTTIHPLSTVHATAAQPASVSIYPLAPAESPPPRAATTRHLGHQRQLAKFDPTTAGFLIWPQRQLAKFDHDGYTDTALPAQPPRRWASLPSATPRRPSSTSSGQMARRRPARLVNRRRLRRLLRTLRTRQSPSRAPGSSWRPWLLAGCPSALSPSWLVHASAPRAGLHAGCMRAVGPGGGSRLAQLPARGLQPGAAPEAETPFMWPHPQVNRCGTWPREGTGCPHTNGRREGGAAAQAAQGARLGRPTLAMGGQPGGPPTPLAHSSWLAPTPVGRSLSPTPSNTAWAPPPARAARPPVQNAHRLPATPVHTADQPPSS